MRKANRRPFCSALAIYSTLALTSMAALGPTLWVMLSSFKTTPQIFSGSGLLPAPVTGQGYIDAFTQIRLHEYLLNTFIYATGGTIGALSLAVLTAYPLARYKFRGRNQLVAIISLALALPVVGLAVPEFFIMRALGLFDTKIGMVIFFSAQLFPLSFVILRSFLLSLPTDLEEAALIDGAGYFRIVFHIVIPLCRPALATAAVVAFVIIWNDFFFANLLTASQENQSVQVALAGFKSQFRFNVTGALAGATIVMLVPIAVFLGLQRHVIAGLTAGSSK
ncbi:MULTISPECIES: carbohydrate ABC transporter permease [unclassified Neorhizobium]|uniref:carbohydrate ABC transporter permease n=1 Tax=unclassified Neorhizobium TaxID=2629175 RepID=UPI001FF3C7F6|nr:MULTISPECIES: carbohydrate ABC transporter permease [unclassified Neorhizobium]MCJ9669936.1 carbohydrate ABC transporter permease [Neorhizobium sp. SHOUNA12B]MCJ9744753.1 carbohydrate ABC transporter permease [Neorhizobium sp. SHOUNA12A]